MSKVPALVIIGAGGHGREILDLVADINAVRPSWDVLGLLDDAEPDGPLLAGVGAAYLGPVTRLAELRAAYAIGVGRPASRRAIDELASGWGRVPATLVHPRAGVGRDVVLGPGSIVAAQANLTTHVRVGRHTHLNVASTVAHDCRLGDYVTVAPGVRLSGGVTIGDDVSVGTGAIVIQNVRVSRGAGIGAGAVVLRDVAPGVVVVGSPARPLPGGDPARVFAPRRARGPGEQS